jgi:hypothetical protein
VRRSWTDHEWFRVGGGRPAKVGTAVMGEREDVTERGREREEGETMVGELELGRGEVVDVDE